MFCNILSKFYKETVMSINITNEGTSFLKNIETANVERKYFFTELFPNLPSAFHIKYF